MKVKRSDHNIIYLIADSQYELTSTFWRLQEYYESPEFRGKFVGMEEYMDWYAERYGNFTYFSDWSGFNVPGDVVREFFQKAPYDLFEKEQRLYGLLEDYINNNEKFYVIGVYDEGSVTEHEYSHAFYYIFPEYKEEMENLISELGDEYLNQIFAELEDKGYHENVFVDEAIAYLSTNDMPYTKSMSGDLAVPWDNILKLQELFQEWRDDKISDE